MICVNTCLKGNHLALYNMSTKHHLWIGWATWPPIGTADIAPFPHAQKRTLLSPMSENWNIPKTITNLVKSEHITKVRKSQFKFDLNATSLTESHLIACEEDKLCSSLILVASQLQHSEAITAKLKLISILHPTSNSGYRNHFTIKQKQK